MLDYKEYISEILFKTTNIPLSIDEIRNLIEIPPQSDMGEYTFPCFSLAKIKRKSPMILSKEISEAIICDSSIVEKVIAVGGYVNFFLNINHVAFSLFNDIESNGADFGSNTVNAENNIIIEYSSTNIAKPFHIGHLRSTVIGDSIKRIYKYLGYKTTAINYVGDYGTQFGIMISAFKKWGSLDKIKRDPIKEMLNLYVRYNQEAEENPNLMDEARYWFNQLEKENPEAVNLWTMFKDLSLSEFKRVYDLLDITFDNFNGESYNSKFIPGVLEELRAKNLLKLSDGAQIVDLSDFNLPPAIVVKSDGSSTYITRDIATAIHRKETYNFSKNLYVVASQQNLHFMQLKAILKLMGKEWSDDCVHVPFGMISLKTGTMATRTGNVIFLEDVLNRAILKSRDLMETRDIPLDDAQVISQDIGIGAIKYQDLFNNRIKDYVFDWDQALSFDGETGPYVQYSRARANSVLEKGKVYDVKDYSGIWEITDEEKTLILDLYRFPEVVRTAASKLEPSIITRHITAIASDFNKFYGACKIIDIDAPSLERNRILLTNATKIILGIGMDLIGLKAPLKM